MAIGQEFRATVANKENECFFCVSDEAMKQLSSKYIPENTDKMIKWAFNTFSAWRDVHSIPPLINLLCLYVSVTSVLYFTRLSNTQPH